MTDQEAQTIMAEVTDADKTNEFLRIIKTRGSKAYDVKTSEYALAREMEPERVAQMPQVPDTSDDHVDQTTTRAETHTDSSAPNNDDKQVHMAETKQTISPKTDILGVPAEKMPAASKDRDRY